MLIEAETQETISFFVTFLSLVAHWQWAIQLGSGRLGPPGYAYGPGARPPQLESHQ